MAKDVIVVVDIDAKRAGTESLDILLVSTEGAKDVATYRDLDKITEAFKGKKVATMAEAMFTQGKTSLADTLIRKVKIVGFEKPANAAGLVEAIEEFRKTDDDFYIVMTDQSDDEYVKALAAWAESTEPTEAELGAGEEDHRKLYFGQTTNKELGVVNARSAIIYTDHAEEFADAAYVGNVGPFYPQSVTWKFKRPQGLTVPGLTNGERDALEEANINFLTVEYKHEYVKNGVCADGNFIDVQMGADYIASLMREKLYTIFLENAKVSYDDAGFSLVGTAAYETLNRAVELGIIAKDPESERGVFTINVPKRSDATDEQARNRQMPDIKWSAQLEGAVHSVKVNGTLRVTLNG